ncbi:MAG: cyclase family protein [Bacillota bacterium]|nr:cyclase family protein [Bacillota bacterium]
MKIVDLSLPVDSKTIVPPSQKQPIEFTRVYREPGHWQATWISMAAHTASHVDSPLHVIEGGPTIAQIPLEKVVGEAVVLDVTDQGVPDGTIDIDCLAKYDGQVKEGDIIIIRTDWGAKMFGTEEYFTQSPILTPAAAHWIVKQKPNAVAFDFFEEYSARLKDFKPDDFEVHQIILGQGIIIIEGLTNLKSITTERFQFFAAPLKLMEAEAAPARIFGILP